MLLISSACLWHHSKCRDVVVLSVNRLITEIIKRIICCGNNHISRPFRSAELLSWRRCPSSVLRLLTHIFEKPLYESKSNFMDSSPSTICPDNAFSTFTIFYSFFKLRAKFYYMGHYRSNISKRYSSNNFPPIWLTFMINKVVMRE